MRAPARSTRSRVRIGFCRSRYGLVISRRGSPDRCRQCRALAGGDAAASRAAVDLAFAEDAEIVAGLVRRGIAGEDRAVEEGEIGLGRMRDGNLPAELRREVRRRGDEVAQLRVEQREAEARG